MSTRTPRQVRPYYRMEQTANLLEAIVMQFLKALTYALQILLIDAVWEKGKYRKRGPYLRYVYKPYDVRQYVPRVVVIHK